MVLRADWEGTDQTVHMSEDTLLHTLYLKSQDFYVFNSFLAFLCPKKSTITKTRLFKCTENFTTKKWKFSEKKNLIFFIFSLKT